MFSTGYFAAGHFGPGYFPEGRTLAARYGLPATALAALRAVHTSALGMPDVVSVRRASEVSDGQGGMVRTWTTVATIYGRLVTLARPAEHVAEGRITADRSWRLYVAVTSGLTAADRVTVGGVDYEVVGVDRTLTEALCLEAELWRME